MAASALYVEPREATELGQYRPELAGARCAVSRREIDRARSGVTFPQVGKHRPLKRQRCQAQEHLVHREAGSGAARRDAASRLLVVRRPRLVPVSERSPTKRESGRHFTFT